LILKGKLENMKILIVEDEALTAKRIKRLTAKIAGVENVEISLFNTLEDADLYITNTSIDLLLLDLNLNGSDGFELLKKAIAGAFHTIIISANVDKALEAFEYGVLDFIPKPFSEERLRKAFMRFEKYDDHINPPAKYLSVIKKNKLSIIKIENVLYIKGAGVYSELHLRDFSVELHNKSLSILHCILPPDFIRVHKSYIVNNNEIVHFKSHGGSKYDLLLKNGLILPVGRVYYKAIKSSLS
jgi:two-component system, LytTR family, response regulator LytT